LYNSFKAAIYNECIESILEELEDVLGFKNDWSNTWNGESSDVYVLPQIVPKHLEA
jgi:hypothetical protein